MGGLAESKLSPRNRSCQVVAVAAHPGGSARTRAWPQTGVVKLRALPDPDLVEQRSDVVPGLLVVPDPGGDEERGQRLVEDRDPGSLVGDDAVDAGPQLPGGGRVGLLRRPRLVGQLVDVMIAERGEVVVRAAGQDRENKVRRGGNVWCPAGEAQLDL